MKSIKYRGKEAVLLSELTLRNNDCVFLTFLQKHDYGLGVIRMDYDGVFGEMKIKEMTITHSELDAIQAFRTNLIGAEEFTERIQLAQ